MFSKNVGVKQKPYSWKEARNRVFMFRDNYLSNGFTKDDMYRDAINLYEIENWCRGYRVVKPHMAM